MSYTLCPECGCPIFGNRKSCPECGCPVENSLPTEDSLPADDSLLEEKQMLMPCNICGHMVSTDTETCPHCGGKVKYIDGGTLKILLEGNGKTSDFISPVYVNNHLVANATLSYGCEIDIPINNPNIKIGYLSRYLYVEHYYNLDVNTDYKLVITNGANLGFTLYDESGNILSADKLNVMWLIFSLLFGLYAIVASFAWNNNRPILSKCMRYWGLVFFSIPLFGIPLMIFTSNSKPENIQ